MKGESAIFYTYNKYGSKKVRVVKTVNVLYVKEHNNKIPIKSDPNSVTIAIKDGKISQERYFDGKGLPYLDIDYTNHGNSKHHPNVPHEHERKEDENGNRQRQEEDK